MKLRCENEAKLIGGRIAECLSPCVAAVVGGSAERGGGELSCLRGPESVRRLGTPKVGRLA